MKPSLPSLQRFLIINLGVFLVALGIHLFRTPNHFAFGGTSGLAIVITRYFPNWPVGGLMLAANILLLLAGLVFLGPKSARDSAYGSLALSIMVWALDRFFPLGGPLTNQKILEFIYAVFIPGIGTALVFRQGATTGGTDVLAQILSKFFHWKISVSLLASDFAIALWAGLTFGVEACLYSLLGVCFKSFVLDAVMESLQIYKIMTIISGEYLAVEHYILSELGRSATVHEARGAYTDQPLHVVTTVLSRRQANALRLYLRGLDPLAFITVSSTSEIIGNGFSSGE